MDIILEPPKEKAGLWKNHDEFIADQQVQMRSAYDAARENLRRYAERRKTTDYLRVWKQKIKQSTWALVLLSSPLDRQVIEVGQTLLRTDAGHKGVVACHTKSLHSKVQVVHVDKLQLCRRITPQSWLDKEETSDDDNEDDNLGLPAMLGRPG